ncbi:MAG: DUF4147 domain-containing protein [Pirellulales bacterium]
MTTRQKIDSSLHAQAIWQAGVEAVTPRSLMQFKIQRDGDWLIFDDAVEVDLSKLRRLIIVGAGKASAAMAVEFLNQHCQPSGTRMPAIETWINCPEGNFVSSYDGPVKLCAARPSGSNSPTQLAIDGTNKIIDLVASATEDDLVICMISGGGSALLVSPRPGISLSDKQAVAKHVAAAGGNIVQLNTVRSCLSRVKSGGLLRHCRTGRMISLIISDVLGDPLNVIASGPTVLDQKIEFRDAIDALEQLRLTGQPELQNVLKWLRSQPTTDLVTESKAVCSNLILGNLADAVDAAGVKAVELGYRYHMQVARQPEGDVHQVALQAHDQLVRIAQQPEIDCWISGGEPTVRLPGENCGKGGRNQQLVLDVLDQMLANGWPKNYSGCEMTFLSGGTDGEDGPTDAAGAWLDNELLQRVSQKGPKPSDYLARADAYNFFDKTGGLLRTGPTGTNVCDLRVGIVVRSPS